jgi:hypothetical protein
MKAGTTVKALKNHNRVEAGTVGVVVDGPKSGITHSDAWVWVQFNKVYAIKLMKPNELEVVNHDMFYG